VFVDDTGRIVKEVRALSDPEALVKGLQALNLPLDWVGLEACSLTAWLHEGLRGRSAGDLHRDAAGQRGQEDDAEQDRSERRAGPGPDHATGWFRQVHVSYD